MIRYRGYVDDGVYKWECTSCGAEYFVTMEGAAPYKWRACPVCGSEHTPMSDDVFWSIAEHAKRESLDD